VLRAQHKADKQKDNHSAMVQALQDKHATEVQALEEKHTQLFEEYYHLMRSYNKAARDAEGAKVRTCAPAGAGSCAGAGLFISCR
jgi:hypothetical protein